MINSASTAFRNFVKEKALYLKAAFDPNASFRTQGTPTEGWQKLHLQSIHKKAPINRARHSQKPSGAHAPLMTGKSKRPKGRKSKSPDKQSLGTKNSPRKGGGDFNDEKRSSLKKPIL